MNHDKIQQKTYSETHSANKVTFTVPENASATMH